MSGRLSVLQLRTSPLKKGPHSPGTEKGSLGCWLFPTPRPPRPGREYPGAGRKGGGTGNACVSTGARGARTAGSGCRGLLTLVLVQLTQGQAPLRPGSIFAAPGAHIQLVFVGCFWFFGWCGVFFHFPLRAIRWCLFKVADPERKQEQIKGDFKRPPRPFHTNLSPRIAKDQLGQKPFPFPFQLQKIRWKGLTIKHITLDPFDRIRQFCVTY